MEATHLDATVELPTLLTGSGAVETASGGSSGTVHSLAYTEWPFCGVPKGDVAAGEAVDTVIAVHGLTRNGRDFDYVAQQLCKFYRVICVHMPGRWKSDWLPDGSCYSYPQYLADIKGLVAHLGVKKFHWLGTSMGGILGIMLAALPDCPFTIGRMVINDVGPFVPVSALRHIGTYVGQDPQFKDIAEAKEYCMATYGNFGLSTQDWDYLIPFSVRPITDRPGVQYALHYDPKIGQAFGDPTKLTDVQFWDVWNNIRVDSILLLRGAASGLLLPEVASEMKEKFLTTHAPETFKLVEFPGIGHAPGLMSEDQIRPIIDFFSVL
eukprot:TRINITY_DN4903_c0_g1_i1.p1 TRINITY_DN4903_c0_g1~~TRINITY_DN4903_c0_g1_i1.p1  ORF type:complete len:323 (-),score=26.20 TRINITY_DN4903_c0_g1_i1:48-1016(-)